MGIGVPHVYPGPALVSGVDTRRTRATCTGLARDGNCHRHAPRIIHPGHMTPSCSVEVMKLKSVTAAAEVLPALSTFGSSSSMDSNREKSRPY